jgi:hypothetical protein
MLGLLHSGYDIIFTDDSENDYHERLQFYFKVADGWSSGMTFQSKNKNGEKYPIRTGNESYADYDYKTPSDLCRMLAKKAYTILCARFFKLDEKMLNTHRDDFMYEWECTMIKSPTFPTLLHFFHVEDKSSSRADIRNLNTYQLSQLEKNVQEFLLTMAVFLWQWKEPVGYISDQTEKQKKYWEVHTKIEAAKLWMIEILNRLGKLDFFEDKILSLELPCVAKLNEIAMREKFNSYEHPVNEDRKVASLDEACYKGSKAAWLVKKYEIMRKEKKRFDAIAEAKDLKESAEKKIRELS